LFSLLAKLSVGVPLRQRRAQQLPPVPTPAADSIATLLARLLAESLSWTPPSYCLIPKLR